MEGVPPPRTRGRQVERAEYGGQPDPRERGRKRSIENSGEGGGVSARGATVRGRQTGKTKRDGRREGPGEQGRSSAEANNGGSKRQKQGGGGAKRQRVVPGGGQRALEEMQGWGGGSGWLRGNREGIG